MHQDFIFETLIDRLFTKFEDSIKSNNIENLIDQMKQLGVNIEIKIERDERVKIPSRKFIASKKLIVLTIPNTKTYTTKDLILTLLHEYTHYIQELYKPLFFTPRTKLNKQQYTDAVLFDLNNNDMNYISNFLKYHYQMTELAPMALVISFSLYNVFGCHDNSIFEFVSGIQPTLNNITSENINSLASQLDYNLGLVMIVNLELYSKKLNSKGVKVKLLKLYRLINKYQRRLCQVL